MKYLLTLLILSASVQAKTKIDVDKEIQNILGEWQSLETSKDNCPTDKIKLYLVNSSSPVENSFDYAFYLKNKKRHASVFGGFWAINQGKRRSSSWEHSSKSVTETKMVKEAKILRIYRKSKGCSIFQVLPGCPFRKMKIVHELRIDLAQNTMQLIEYKGKEQIDYVCRFER